MHMRTSNVDTLAMHLVLYEDEVGWTLSFGDSLRLYARIFMQGIFVQRAIRACGYSKGCPRCHG